MRFFNRRKQPPTFTRHNISVTIIIVALFFLTGMAQVAFMPHEHDGRNIATELFSPPPTPTPDPVIEENEIIKQEIDNIRGENGRMTEYIFGSRGGFG